MSGVKRAVPDVFSPARLGPVLLRNRVIKAASSEGRSPAGLVTDELIQFHVGYVRGGVAMTTVAYCTVSPDGFSGPGQILMSQKSLPGLRRLTRAVHDAGGAVCAQLGHAGAVAQMDVTRCRPLAPSRFWNPMTTTWCRGISREEIRGAQRSFADAAEMAAEAGFDAVELHFGHLYLVSSFLSPWMNKRKDEYGGSLENRARFALETASLVRERVGRGRVAVTAKLSMLDDIPGSIWLDESLQTAKMLDRQGCLDAIELTQGSSVYKPMFLFGGDSPVRDVANMFHQPMKSLVKATVPRMMGSYPYRDLYMLESARQFVPAMKNTKLVLLGGINNHAHMQRAMEEGFEFVAMARALMREPDLVGRIEKDRSVQGLCLHCNRCMFTVFSKTKCPLHPDYAISATASRPKLRWF